MNTKIQKTIDSCKKIGKAYLFGANFIPESIINVIDYALASECDNNVQAIFITNSGPHKAFGEYCKHSRSFIINLNHIIWSALNNAKKNPLGISIPAIITCDIVHTIYHELFHNIAKAVAVIRDEDEDENYQVNEDEVDEYAEYNMEKTIHELQLECVNITTLSGGAELIETLKEEIKNDKKMSTHLTMIEEGIVFENKDCKHLNLSKYLKDTTKYQEIYQSNENAGAEMKMMKVQSEMTNMFDKQIVPGQQMNLFNSTAPATPANTHQVIYEDDEYDDSPPWDDDEPIAETLANQMVVDLPSEEDENEKEVIVNKPQQNINNNLQTIKGLYMKMYDHIFEKCGFINGTYLNINNIYQPIQLTEAEASLIIASKTILSDGTTGYANASECGNQVAGLLFKDGTVPAYHLLVRWGKRSIKVRLVAQNTARNSEYAARAKAGERIMWLIDYDNNKFMNKIINGEYLPA